MSWFECKAKFDRLTDDGTIKKVSEPYMVNALSFTEAEARIIGFSSAWVTAAGSSGSGIFSTASCVCA